MIELLLSAGERGDLLLFEIGPDGVKPFASRDYEGDCESIRNEKPGSDLPVNALFPIVRKQPGMNAFVAVLVSSSSDLICERIAETLAPAIAQTADPAWPDEELTATIRAAIDATLRAQNDAVRGFDLYLYPVMGY